MCHRASPDQQHDSESFRRASKVGQTEGRPEMVITGWDPVIWGPVSDSVRIKAFSPAHLDTGGYGPTPFTARDSGRPQPSPDIGTRSLPGPGQGRVVSFSQKHSTDLAGQTSIFHHSRSSPVFGTPTTLLAYLSDGAGWWGRMRAIRSSPSPPLSLPEDTRSVLQRAMCTTRLPPRQQLGALGARQGAPARFLAPLPRFWPIFWGVGCRMGPDAAGCGPSARAHLPPFPPQKTLDLCSQSPWAPLGCHPGGN